MNAAFSTFILLFYLGLSHSILAGLALSYALLPQQMLRLLTLIYFLISSQSYLILFLFNFLLTDLNTFIIDACFILFYSIVIENDDIFSKKAFVTDMMFLIS